VNEQRRTSRKIVKVKALLNIEGAETVQGRTLEVGGDGVCLQLDHALKPGALGTVQFQLFQDNDIKTITARSRVQYCILGNGGFKIGLQFVNLDLPSMAVISKFLH
jgi:hypothetical protein